MVTRQPDSVHAYGKRTLNEKHGRESVRSHRDHEGGFDPVNAVRGTIRAAPWVTIAISAHVLAGAIFAIVHFASEARPDVDTPLMIGRALQRPDELPPPEPEKDLFDHRFIPDTAEVDLATRDMPRLVDVLEADENLATERGDPDALDVTPGTTGGTAIGTGGPGIRGTMPTAFGGRVPGKGGRVDKPGTGGIRESVETEKAVLDGMIWLARHQDESGGWLAPTFMEHCPPGAPCQPETALSPGQYSNEADVGLTSLALLCFLGAGHGHTSRTGIIDRLHARRHFIGRDIVKPGLQWLVDHQNADGSFTSGRMLLYNEALAALALSEAYGLTGEKAWREPAQRAIDFLCRAQKPDPSNRDALWGWRYEPHDPLRTTGKSPAEISDADMSVTGWMVMALKSAEASRLEVPRRSLDGALAFTRWSTGRRGLVGYTGPDTAGQTVFGDHDDYAYHVGTMSSIGMCIRIFLESDLRDPFLFEAADVLLADLPSLGTEARPQLDYYYWYYGSLALNQLDGPDAPQRSNRYWGPWNRAMTDTILALQDHAEDACTGGGWMVPDRWAYGFGPVYTTAINVLSLEVYYRYANAFGAKQERERARPDDRVRAGMGGLGR